MLYDASRKPMVLTAVLRTLQRIIEMQTCPTGEKGFLETKVWNFVFYN